jgi:hypothetical protein
VERVATALKAEGLPAKVIFSGGKLNREVTDGGIEGLQC